MTPIKGRRGEVLALRETCFWGRMAVIVRDERGASVMSLDAHGLRELARQATEAADKLDKLETKE